MNKRKPALTAKDKEFYVVGVGASAGGLNALRTLFGEMPPEPGYACVVVVHLSPEHESHLVELLQPHTRMPVQQVSKTVPLKPNHVYVIPPNANLEAIDTHLRLSELEERRIQRATVDHFLRTLAATQDGLAVGVILTGAGTDGSLGIRLVKECGGLTIAQDPEEAEFDGMPRSAINTGTVDLVLPLRKIPEAVGRFCATRPRLPVKAERSPARADHELHLDQILQEIERRVGQDYALYRRETLLKRIRHRMQLHHLEELSGYLARVRTDPEEAQELHQEMLLHVTEFFRDAKLFEALEHRLLPDLFARQVKPVRVWSIGCATGEEAYSLAMLLIELAERFQSTHDVQIFASDLSDDALQRARHGLYPHEVAATVSPARLERFFMPEDSQLRIRRDVRERVVFAAHNVLKDPPYTHVNLILCRSLLGELQPEVRNALVNLFHYALEEGGSLVVGEGNEVNAPELFARDESSPNIFHRLPGARREAATPWLMMRPFTRASPDGAGVLKAGASIEEIYRNAIERHAPPTILVDGTGDVLRFSTRAYRYVRLPGGVLTNALGRMLPDSIQQRLEEGFEEVGRTGRAWASQPFTAQLPGGGQRELVLRIDPLREGDGPDARLLVIFDEQAVAAPSPEKSSLAPALREAQLPAAGEGADNVRDTLEQLEASREELRTINDELIALDSENRARISELVQTSGDLRNILDSTLVATLVLDERLRIVRFTEQAERLLRLTPIEVGWRLRDLELPMKYPDIEEEAGRVLLHQTRVDREVATDDRWYLVRMLPYRTMGRGVAGVVVSFIDITDRKRAEAALREIEERQRLVVELVPALLWWADPGGKDVEVNYRWKAYTGQDEADVSEFGWLDAMHPDDLEATRAAFRHAFATGEPLEREQRIRSASGEYRWHIVRHVPLRDEEGVVTRWFGAAIDIHESRMLQDRQQMLLAELHHRTRNLITVVRALSERTLAQSASVADFRDKFNRRLAALARVQGLLSHLTAGERVTFDQLLRSELAALGAPEEKLALEGPEGVPLRSTMVQTMALALHELATNAVKYGALSQAQARGRLSVRWRVEPEPGSDESVLHVEWRESGVSMPDASEQPRGSGYGRELIESALPYQLKAKTTYVLGPDGVRCTIAVPVPWVTMPEAAAVK